MFYNHSEKILMKPYAWPWC